MKRYFGKGRRLLDGRKRKYVNIFIAVAAFGSWIAMSLYGQSMLAEPGLSNPRYFTVLSNLLTGTAAVIWLAVSDRGGEGLRRAETLKFVAAAAVGLTFTVVMVFLGPLYGYPMMFTGANFFFHLIIPLVAAAEIIFLSDAAYTARDNLLAVIPTLIYGSIYLLNNYINGIGEWPDTNDWYSFLRWGYPVGIAIFAIACVITWLIGLMMRKCNAAHRLKKTERIDRRDEKEVSDQQ